MFKTVLTAILCCSTVQVAHAFCMEPRAPSAPWGNAPTAPICFGDRGCDQWEIDAFHAEVERYIGEMQNYSDAAVKFAKQATEFAACEANQAVDNWNQFVNDLQY